jgi:hypothetical protein
MICRAILLASVLVGSAGAQEANGFGALQRKMEMPAHRSLMGVIEAPDSALAPFETDGCSGGMSSSWRVVADLFPDFAAAQGDAPPWEPCCVTHDRTYHDAGGARTALESFEARLAADEALRQCVAAPSENEVTNVAARYEVDPDRVRFAYTLVADSMFNAVRFGGGPCSGLPWRWGFGYPGCLAGF